MPTPTLINIVQETSKYEHVIEHAVCAAKSCTGSMEMGSQGGIWSLDLEYVIMVILMFAMFTPIPSNLERE